MKAAIIVLIAGLVAGCTATPAPYAGVPSTATSTPPPTPQPHLIGALNPDVTQDTIHRTVCVAGWTARIRPPASYTTRLKRAQLPRGARLADWKEDHLMPLGLGGAPYDPANLRPIPIARAKADDVWETRLHREVCSGLLTLTAAQVRISAVKEGEDHP